jgi:Bifunctional DNA primase/polymerase, N-terminal
MAAWGVNLPAVPWACTPSGGRHLWLRLAGSLRSVQGALPGVDLKADGGYVVSAPSMLLHTPMDRPGEPSGSEPVPVPYRWADGCCPCQAPPTPFEAASDRFTNAEAALDSAREDRAQARRERYAARQAYQRASTTADRLARLVREAAERLDRMTG